MEPLNPDWQPNRDICAEMVPIGDGGERYLVIDDVLREPERLRNWAIREGRFERDMGGLYPGVRSPLPLDYARSIIALVDPLLREAFQLDNVKLSKADFVLSMVTTKPADLLPFQRIPHIDSSSPFSFAVLHYHCLAAHGGTGFFRQRPTGIATVSLEKEAEWAAARDAALARRLDPPAYIGASDPDYELIGQVDAQWDRLIVYPGNLLHSGLIGPDGPLSDHPSTGRVTSNLFLDYRPA